VVKKVAITNRNSNKLEPVPKEAPLNPSSPLASLFCFSGKILPKRKTKKIKDLKNEVIFEGF
jgi:hypothetical protein